ncbi:Eukaryotic translation initiation factor 5A [Mortierella alpina]|nr:Eukaryotic translation initiation factor 5A [Mortierella alpina]
MAEQSDHDFFDNTGAGASLTHPMQCSALHKNSHVIIEGRPCMIVEILTSKTGGHDGDTINLIGIDIFTGKKYEIMSPSTRNMDVPLVSRSEYQAVDVSDGFLSLMDSSGGMKDNVKLPEGDLGRAIVAIFDAEKDFLVTILSAMGQEAAVAFRECPKE